MAFNVTYDIVSISRVASEYAVCRTSYGAEITVYWSTGKPDPLPKTGETWRVEQFSRNVWRFVSNVPRGTYRYMSYAISLDARDCIGRERAIADDISGAGFDCVYLNVADYGEVMWDSKVASSMGLASYGDNVTQLVNRLKSKNLNVMFVIGATLWSDIANPVHNRYQQVIVDGENASFSQKMSIANAANDISSLVNELKEKYGTQVNGVCFWGLGFDGENADFGHGMSNIYYGMTGERLSYDLAQYDLTDDWFERRNKFAKAQSAAFAVFTSSISSKVGAWPISVVVPSSVCAIGDATTKVGELGTGVQDDIGSRGFTRVGFQLNPKLSSDMSSEMRSFETQVATLIRFSQGCKPLPVLDSSKIDSIDGELEILAKYGAGEVIVTDYRRWRLLTDAQMIALSNAMSTYKVYVDSYDDCVGVLLSSMTTSVGCYYLDDIVEFRDGFESVCAEVINNVPHKLKIMFDSDLTDDTYPAGISAILLCNSMNMTDDAVEFIKKLSGVGVVFVGECGLYDGLSRNKRSVSPFAAEFNQSFSETVDFEKYLQFAPGAVDVANTVYSLNGYCNGYVPTFGETGSYAMVNGEDDAQNAPVIISGRSSMVGMSLYDEAGIQSMIGELMAYAVGRG